MRFDVVGLTCRMKSVLMTATFKVQGSRFLRSKRPQRRRARRNGCFRRLRLCGILSTWHLALGKFGEHEYKELLEAQLLSLFRALQTSQVINISTYAQLKHEPIVFYNIVKAINAEVNQIFIIVALAQTSPHNYVFALKLRETLLKSLKIITRLKKIVKSKLSCRKTVQ